MTLSIYHDVRNIEKSDEVAPLCFIIRNQGTMASFPTGIKVTTSQWKNGKIVKHRYANEYNRKLFDLETQLNLYIEQELGKNSNLPAKTIKNRILQMQESQSDKKEISLKDLFALFIPLKNKKNTIESFQYTLDVINIFSPVEYLYLEDITVEWLYRFENWLLYPPKNSGRKAVKRNTCKIHLQNLRAVYN